MYILGLSCFYHDSAAALIKDGEIIASAQEERFTRIKHDSAFPEKAIQYCFSEAEITPENLSFIVYYDKPFLTFERLVETFIHFAPRGWIQFLKSMPFWLGEKLYLKQVIRKKIAKMYKMKKKNVSPIRFSYHHQSHAASAFFPSPYKKAAVLCVDGVGEWATTSAWIGEDQNLTPLWEIRFPHSLGLLYSAFTYYTGFKVNSGEYKLMGLAPYGEPRYIDLIQSHLIDVKEDGSFRLNLKYFDFPVGSKMISKEFEKLFGNPSRKPNEKILTFHKDIARSVQWVLEDILLKLAQTLRKETQSPHLVLAGGVALNCVANSRFLQDKVFDKIWVQPAAGDAGGALGAALSFWHEGLNQPKKNSTKDSMKNALLGPQFSEEQIQKTLENCDANYTLLPFSDLTQRVAQKLSEGHVVGWFQGRMEYGPRALGNRSILGDPRKQDMQQTMNLKIKMRESFRPFAPAVLQEEFQNHFHWDQESPYMLFTAPVKTSSSLPAITHVDGSARLQTVSKEDNPKFHQLLKAFFQTTGCPVLINTSFNVRGEPMVCTPYEAYRCFMNTDIDYLAMGPFLLAKKDQPLFNDLYIKEVLLD